MQITPQTAPYITLTALLFGRVARSVSRNTPAKISEPDESSSTTLVIAEALILGKTAAKTAQVTINPAVVSRAFRRLTKR